MKNQKLGFTLMELLVVIVIIGILAAMLFPVLSRIQERGREVKCASNLRQLHQAAMSFVNNNSDGVLPYASSSKYWWIRPDGTYGHDWRTGWVASHPMNTDNMKSYWWEAGGSNGTYCITNGTLFGYLGDAGDESVYVCPTMLVRARDVMTGEYRNVVRSFGMNRDLSGVKYSDIDGLSRRILFADQGFDLMPGASQSLRNTGDATHDLRPLVQSAFEQRFFRGVDGCIDYDIEKDQNGIPIPRKATPLKEYIGELHGRKPGANTGMANAIFADGHVERVGYVNTTNVCSGNWEYGKVPQ